MHRPEKKPSFVTPPVLERLVAAERPFAELAAPDATIEEREFADTEICGVDCRRLTLRGCRFRNVRFRDCRLTELALWDVVFDHCDLSNCRLHGVRGYRVGIERSKLLGADLSDATFNHLKISGSNLGYINFSMSRMTRFAAERCDLRESVWIRNRWQDVRLAECNLTAADLSGTSLAGVDLTTCLTDGIAVAPADLRGAVVTTFQAAALARIMGLVIRD